MRILITSIGRRGYLADYFRAASAGPSTIIGTTDRHSVDREFTVGLESCDSAYVVPSVTDEDYMQSILSICERERVDIVCSALDIDNQTLALHRDELVSQGVTPFISSSSVNDICMDKYETFVFWRDHGVSTPVTFLALDEFEKAELGYPVVIKPRRGWASDGYVVVSNREMLRALFVPGEHIIQEFLDGDEYSLDILCNLEAEISAFVAKRKIRMRAGETDQAITVKDAALEALAKQIAGELKPVGPLDVDIIRRGDELHVIDMNPRFGGGYPLSHAAGADFPQRMMDMVRGESGTQQPGEYREGVVMLKDASPRIFSLQELDNMVVGNETH